MFDDKINIFMMLLERFSWGVSRNDATEFYGVFIKAYKNDVKNRSKIEKPIIQGRSQLQHRQHVEGLSK
jgi:hypothetical protein